MSKQTSTSRKALSNEAKEDDEQLDEESNEVEADDTGSNTLIVLYKKTRRRTTIQENVGQRIDWLLPNQVQSEVIHKSFKFSFIKTLIS